MLPASRAPAPEQRGAAGPAAYGAERYVGRLR